jgi:hypothetical protein
MMIEHQHCCSSIPRQQKQVYRKKLSSHDEEI